MRTTVASKLQNNAASSLHIAKPSAPSRFPMAPSHRLQVAANSVSSWRDAAAAVTTISTAALLLAGPSFAKIPETTLPGSNSGFLTDEEIDIRRDRLNFLRAYDGHVAIKNKQTDEFWDVKCDFRSPGTILLRDQDGQVYYISFAQLKQVDLSDDEVVAAIATDNWEQDATAIQGVDESGEQQKLELTREGFYGLMSVFDP